MTIPRQRCFSQEDYYKRQYIGLANDSIAHAQNQQTAGFLRLGLHVGNAINRRRAAIRAAQYQKSLEDKIAAQQSEIDKLKNSRNN